MVQWVRGLAALSVAAVLLSAAAAGCGGLSASDAELRCKQEQMDIADCFDSNVLTACEACYESCGDSCTRTPTCPLTYSCAGISTTTSSSGGGASASTGSM
jgi:hypothetical protein